MEEERVIKTLLKAPSRMLKIYTKYNFLNSFRVTPEDTVFKTPYKSLRECFSGRSTYIGTQKKLGFWVGIRYHTQYPTHTQKPNFFWVSFFLNYVLK